MTETEQAKAGIIKKTVRSHHCKSRGNGGDKSRGEKQIRLSAADVSGKVSGKRYVKRDKVWLSGTWNGENRLTGTYQVGELLFGGHCVKKSFLNCRPDHFRWNPKYRVAGQV